MILNLNRISQLILIFVLIFPQPSMANSLTFICNIIRFQNIKYLNNSTFKLDYVKCSEGNSTYYPDSYAGLCRYVINTKIRGQDLKGTAFIKKNKKPILYSNVMAFIKSYPEKDCDRLWDHENAGETCYVFDLACD